MSKRHRTPEEEKQYFDSRAESIARWIPHHEYRAFMEAHTAEINRQIIIIELLQPTARAQLGDARLRFAAELLIWLKHKNGGGGDDWRRPRKPKPPTPLLPPTTSPRIREDA